MEISNRLLMTLIFLHALRASTWVADSSNMTVPDMVNATAAATTATTTAACDFETQCLQLDTNKPEISTFWFGNVCYVYNKTIPHNNFEANQVCGSYGNSFKNGFEYYGRLATFSDIQEYACVMAYVTEVIKPVQPVMFGACDINMVEGTLNSFYWIPNGDVNPHDREGPVAATNINNVTVDNSLCISDSDNGYGINGNCVSVDPSGPGTFSVCRDTSFLCEIGCGTTSTNFGKAILGDALPNVDGRICSFDTPNTTTTATTTSNISTSTLKPTSTASELTTTTKKLSFSYLTSTTTTSTSHSTVKTTVTKLNTAVLKTGSESTTPKPSSSAKPTTTTTSKPDVHKSPMNEQERKVATVLHSLGCLWLISCLAVTIVLNFLTNFRTMDRQLHLCQELSLLLCHILIYFYVEATRNQSLCTWVSIGIQYFTITYYCFLLCEAVRSYSYITKVIVDADSTVGGSIVVGWIMPLIITVGTAVRAYDRYASNFSCWLNIGDTIAVATIGPVVFLVVVSVIVIEAAGAYRPKPDASFLEWYNDNPNAANAQLNRTGIFWILPLSLSGWMMGLSAVYYQNFPAYSIVFALNLAVGFAIVFFHTARNEKIQSLVGRIYAYGKKTLHLKT